ncbi:MAG: glycosyltransferase family 4 protein [Acidothermales bacterium]|nr:glycosyltransferase family 4 protein [Acidothermales bacterium]
MLTNALLAGVLTAALSPVLIVALRRLGTLDTPTHRSSHTMPTVRGGGLAPALAGTGVLALGATALGAPRLGVVVAAAGFATVGLIEDVRGIAVTRRLALHVLAAAAALPWLAAGLTGPRGWPLVTAVLVVGWLTAYVNVVNFMDGINGITGVQAAVVGTAWYLVGIATDVVPLAGASLILVGVAVGFLPYNFPRARVFPGDVGSYFFGAWLGALAVVGLRGGIAPEAMLAPLGVSLADTCSTLIRRVYRGEVWHQAHRQHVYQRLVQRGWSHGQVTATVGVVIAVCAGLGALSLTASLPARVAADAGIVAVLALYLASPWLVDRHLRRISELARHPAGVQARARG